MLAYLFQVLAPASTIFGLDMQSITALGVALIAGLAAYFTATVTATKNAKSASKTAEATTKNTRQIEIDKREYVANGQRRKLNLLFARSATSLNICRLTNGTDVQIINRAAKEVYDFVITPELASAVEDEQKMNAVYDVLYELELAADLAAKHLADVKRWHQEDVYEGHVDAEYDSMWDDKKYQRMIGFLVPPLEKLADYFTLVPDLTRAELVATYVTDAKQQIASLTPIPWKSAAPPVDLS